MKRPGSTWILRTSLAVFGALALGGNEARAGLLVNFDSVTPIGNDFEFHYSAAITGALQEVAAGDFFQIYDFPSYIFGSATAPANWEITVELISRPPPNVNVPDDPNIFNVTFTYTGAEPLLGPASLGNFTAEATVGNHGRTGDFAGQNTDISTVPPSLIGSQGDVIIPGFSAAVPEPSSLILAGIAALLGLSLWARRRAALRVG